MKRKVRKGGCIFGLVKLFVVAVLVLGLVIYFLAPYIATHMVHYTGKVVGVDVELGSMTIAYGDQKVELGEFHIYNPEGFSKGKAIAIKKLVVDLDVGTALLTKNVIEIDEISLEGFELGLEILGAEKSIASLLGKGATNLTAITEKLDKFHTEKTAETQAKKTDAKEYKFIAKKISFKDGRVKGGVAGKAVVVAIPDFELIDIGVDAGGLTPTQLSIKIAEILAAKGVEHIIAETGKEGVKEAVDAVKGLEGALEGIFK